MDDLFTASGIELDESGRAGGRLRRSPRTLRVPLFNYKVVAEARKRFTFDPTPQQLLAATGYANTAKSPKFVRQKEPAVRALFTEKVLGEILGYTPYDPEQQYTLAHERAIRSGAVDVALGRFGGPDNSDEMVAPFELKGPGTHDLDAVMPGRGRSPVQQAWDYAIDAPGSRWVLVSNCVEIRLYGFGRGRDAYEMFNLTKLDDPEEHARLCMVLSAARLLGGATDTLLRETDSAYKDITGKLYVDYKALHERLIAGRVRTGRPGAETSLLAFLNSKVAWFQWIGETPIASGGYIRLKQQYIAPTAIPNTTAKDRKILAKLGEACSAAAKRRFDIQSAVRHRILDLAPPERAKLSRKLEEWWTLDFAAFREEAKRVFRTEVPVKERADWEAYLGTQTAQVRALDAEIDRAEREIDSVVYRLFDLTPDEIALLEASVTGKH